MADLKAEDSGSPGGGQQSTAHGVVELLRHIAEQGAGMAILLADPHIMVASIAGGSIADTWTADTVHITDMVLHCCYGFAFADGSVFLMGLHEPPDDAATSGTVALAALAPGSHFYDTPTYNSTSIH